jgi:outer membrane protein insertion porin family
MELFGPQTPLTVATAALLIVGQATARAQTPVARPATARAAAFARTVTPPAPPSPEPLRLPRASELRLAQVERSSVAVSREAVKSPGGSPQVGKKEPAAGPTGPAAGPMEPAPPPAVPAQPAPVQPDAAPAPISANRVAEVVIEGTQNISREAVLLVLATKPGTEVSAATLERDREAIRRMGFFRAVAPPRVEETPAGKRVIFSVTEWPKVKEIRITGNKVIPTEAIRAALGTKEGEVLNSTVLEQDLDRIKRLYQEKGYVGNVTEELALGFEETGVLTIPISELTIEAIKVVGNRKTKTQVIMRELEMKPGQVYSLNDIRRDYGRLERLQLFETIEPTPAVGSEPGKVVVTWTVKERRTGQVSVGLGYSARESLVGRAELSETNFRGWGQGLNLQWEVGGSDVGNSLEFGFFEPWLDRRHTSLSLNIYDKAVYRFSTDLVRSGTSDEDGRYSERRRGGAVTLGRPLSDITRLSLGFRHDDVRSQIEELGTADFPRQDGTVTSTTLRGVRDTRNYATNPTGGGLSTTWLELGYADMDENSTENFDTSTFLKYVFDLRRYVGVKRHRATNPLERQREKIPVLATRMMLGLSTGQMPFFEQFFLGGADSIRGYLEDRFWGSKMFLFSAEMRYPLASSFAGVFFIDVGDAWDSDSDYQFSDPTTRTQFEQHSGFKPSAGVGIGMRVVTPIGPLRLDWAIGNEGSRTHFSIGHSF